MRVFVISKKGKPLMPCRARKARILLKTKQAKIISYKPFTIQLQYNTSGYTQEIHFGIDTGARHIGLALTSQGRILWKGEVELRQDIHELLETKKIYRRGRRNRKTRYRKMRFNRSKPTGWLPPSIESRLQSTFQWIDKISSYLPKVILHIEVGKFDIQKMEKPNIKGKEYQEGEQADYNTVRSYVFARDNYTCQICKHQGKILHTHHIIYRSKGGTNRTQNLLTVCSECHNSKNHKQGGKLYELMTKRFQINKSYKEATFMNILRSRIFIKYPTAYITYGNITIQNRKYLKLSKTHYNDAIAIAIEGVMDNNNTKRIKENPYCYANIKQVRKKKRSLHEATARKGRKTPNYTAKRNSKNTKQVKHLCIYDTVKYNNQKGYISGFSGNSSVYIRSYDGKLMKAKDKNHNLIGIKNVKLIHHNNNWIFNSQKSV